MITQAGSVVALRLTIGIWAAGVVVAVVASAALVYEPLLLIAAAVVTAVGAVFILAFTEPRWVLVAQIGLIISYTPIVLSERFGVPFSPQTLTILLLLGVLARRLLDAERLPMPRAAALLAALLGAMLLSLVFAADRARGLLEVSEFVELGILALLVVALLDTPVWLRRGLWAFGLCVGALAALAVFQQVTNTHSFDYFGYSKIDEGDRDLLRSGGPIDPNFFAQLLIASTSVVVYLGLASARLTVRVGAILIAMAGVGAILYTYSRGALLGVAAALGAAAILRRVRPWIPIAGAAGLLLAAALVLPADAKQRFTQVVKPGDSGIAHASDESVANRFAENLAAIHMFRDNPLFGVGPGNYSVQYLTYAQSIGLDNRAEERTGVEHAAHNLYLESLAELGLLGASAFFAVIGFAVRGAFLLRGRLPGRDALIGEGLLVGFVGYFTAAVFLHGAFPHLLWIVLGLGLAAGRVARNLEVRPQ